MEKANKEQRKEKRKEKKEKSKEKKEKKRLKKENKEIVNTKLTDIDLAHKDVKNLAEFDVENSHKRKHEDIEQLEGSSVTEEHGQPLNLQNPSYSSDGTQNSNKRRKQASFASDGRGNGNIIRIKLPLQKHKESESTVSKEQLNLTSAKNVQNKESDVKDSKVQPCSTSGRNEMHNEQIYSGSGWTDLFVYPGQDVSRASQVDASLTLVGKSLSLPGLPCPSNELCSTSGNADDVFAQGHAQTSVSVPGSCSTSQDKKMQKKISKYDSLIQNLYQMTVPSEVVDNDGEDWLFGGKCSDTVVKKRNVEKQLPVNSSVTCSGSSTLYPRARYLEEAKIYALPYTVPF